MFKLTFQCCQIGQTLKPKANALKKNKSNILTIQELKQLK